MIKKINNKIMSNKVCSNISNIDDNKKKLEKKIKKKLFLSEAKKIIMIILYLKIIMN